MYGSEGLSGSSGGDQGCFGTLGGRYMPKRRSSSSRGFEAIARKLNDVKTIAGGRAQVLVEVKCARQTEWITVQ